MTQTFAANWLDISINLLLVIHVIICLLLALVVLMQRPKQEGLGAAFGGGLTDQAFGAQTTNVLQKGTVYLGTLFFVITLVLAILIGKQQAANPDMAGEKDKTEDSNGPASDSLKKDDGEDDAVNVPGKDDQPEAEKDNGADGDETPPASDQPEAEAEKPEENKPVEPEAPEAPATGGAAGSSNQ